MLEVIKCQASGTQFLASGLIHQGDLRHFRFALRHSTEIKLTSGSLNPEAAHTVDTNAGQADSTATASGGDGSYTFAWTITETEDNNVGAAGCAVLAAGTQNAAQYDTATFRVTQPARFQAAHQ